MKGQIAGFIDNSLTNGKKLRSVVFFSGCPIKCKGCHNKEIQRFDYGTTENMDDVFNKIKDNLPLIDGVTISGGEASCQYSSLMYLLKRIKEDLFLDVWLYTGYTYSEFIKDNNKKELLKYIDVLVDGPFIKERPKAKYRGSDNQKIIDVKRTLKENKIVEYELY